MSATSALPDLLAPLVPEPVAMWPQTTGWQVLGAALAAVVVWQLARQLRRWRANGYRREQLARLKTLEQRAEHVSAVLTELPVMLKATALQAFPRADVAALSGGAWLEFLDARWPQTSGPAFSSEIGRALLRVAYHPPDTWDIDDVSAHQLIDMTRAWIRQHSTEAT